MRGKATVMQYEAEYIVSYTAGEESLAWEIEEKAGRANIVEYRYGDIELTWYYTNLKDAQQCAEKINAAGFR